MRKPIVVAEVVIPAPYQVRGKLQRGSGKTLLPAGRQRIPDQALYRAGSGQVRNDKLDKTVVVYGSVSWVETSLAGIGTDTDTDTDTGG